MKSIAVAILAIVCCSVSTSSVEAWQEPTVENVIFITLDGLRWQEVFGGADARLLSGEGGVRNVDLTRREFWRTDAIERREKLLPFLWGTMVPQGQLFGDPEKDCVASVTNGMFFSYPGYNEILSGRADSRIDSNLKRNNPNVTILEWLNGQPEFQEKVAAFCSWDVFPFIINEKRSGVPVNAGWEPIEVGPEQEVDELNRWSAELPRYWDNVRYDYVTFRAAEIYLQTMKPRVLYVALGETDDWAHDGRYDLYLDSARRNDDYIRRLWETAQSMEQYKGKTALVITTDHGRGEGFEGWKSHGADIPGSDRIWIAVLGPCVPAHGVRQDVEVTQSQVAQTVAKLLGKNFQEHNQEIADGLPLEKE